ncbi:DUF1254 domain-containing protein [Roseibium sp. RP-7]
MNSFLTRGMLLSALVASASGDVTAQEFKADVPKSIQTPDVVETETLGKLDFFNGLPSPETVRKSYDFLDVARATEAFIAGVPTASLYAVLEGFKSVGMQPCDLGIFEDLLDARALFLTPNTTNVYAMMEINVKDGPVVVDVPPGVLGPVQDAFFRYVTDFGPVGPDEGKGGRYVFAHERYKGPLPEDAFQIRTKTYRNGGFFRAFVKDGDTAAATNGIKESFSCYPFTRSGSPPEQRFVDLTGKKFNTIHSNDFTFFEEINAVIQYEPTEAYDPVSLGLFASIGIQKGKAFEPDERMRSLLKEGVAIGNAAARSISFANRDRSVYYYPDRQWYASFAGPYDFIEDGALNSDKRVLWFYNATGVTPAMSTPQVGTGSVYPMAVRDSDGNYLDGGESYSVTLPAPVPVNNFWAFTAYDGQTRSLLETDQRSAGLDSTDPDVTPNDDGSYTVYFGPSAPEGKESNWVQTAPGKSYFVFMRLYGPLEPWFDKTWKPGDFRKLD